MLKVSIQARRPLETFNIRVYNSMAKKIEVEVILKNKVSIKITTELKPD